MTAKLLDATATPLCPLTPPMLSEDDHLAFDDYSNDLEPDYAYLESRSEDPSPPPLAELPPRPNVRSELYKGYTQALCQKARVYDCITYMNTMGLNLELFLNAVFWGDSSCISNSKIRHERMVFMNSTSLPAPPTQDHASGGKNVVQEFVMEHAGEMLEKEVKAATPYFRVPEGVDPLSHHNLTWTNFREFGIQLQSKGTPLLWRVLQRLAWMKQQQQENKMKNPFHVILTIISMIFYSQSHENAQLPMVWSVYMTACGVPAHAFDILHVLGLVMSHKRTADVFATISRNASTDTRKAIRKFSHFGSHDNLNIPMCVFSQRIANMNHFINASAATIYILPPNAHLPPDIASKVIEQQYPEYPETNAACDRITAQARYQILRFLLKSPAFSQYPHLEDPLLAAPPPTELLPCRPAHVTKQHILQTVKVDESTYDGTDHLCNNIWLQQMGISEDDLRELIEGTTGQILVWVGDQLTVECIHGLIQYHYDDINFVECMDFYEPHFGWFHATMAFTNSLHAQYLGTSAGIGLWKVFKTLGRKGLMKQETKGVFYHHLDEALWHIREAHFFSLWMEVGGVDDLDQLVCKTPRELVDLLEKIVSEHASHEAIHNLTMLPSGQCDDVKRQTVMFATDVLPYFNLCEVIQTGDVGQMEDLLPTLLFRFAGGSNPKNTIKILELLQKLKCEWPPEFRDYVWRHCWLVNFTGKCDGFTAVDMVQEHNIKDIKVTWQSFGPGAMFAYIQKVSPVIPTLRTVKANVSSQFLSVIERGSHHGTPSKEQDVERLIKMYKTLKLHSKEIGGQRIHGRDAAHAVDVMTQGSVKLMVDGVADRWWDERNFERNTTEIYLNAPVTQHNVTTSG
ncbi:hypothetical protein V8D89_011463 [Ganoderma adspersum]